MQMARQRRDHGARRSEIADAACKVILAVGLEETKLKDIAAELGFTTGVIQHYFTDKEDLLLFAKNQLFDRAFGQISDAARDEHGVQRLVVLAGELLPLSAEQIDMFRLLAAFRGRAVGRADLMALQAARDAVGWDLFANEIRALQAAGELSPGIDAEAEAVGITAFVEGLATQLITGAAPLDEARLLALLRRHIETALAP